MEATEKLQKHVLLEHEVAINASPEKIWDFLVNIDKNYSAWHPKDHILFQWTSGNPFEAGATFYAEQYMLGEKVKYKGKITENIPGKKITMRFGFPLSLITEKIEMTSEGRGDKSIFKHLSYYEIQIFIQNNIQKTQCKDAKRNGCTYQNGVGEYETNSGK